MADMPASHAPPSNVYFDVTEPQSIEDVETLLSLNIERTYFRPGDTQPMPPQEAMLSIYSMHETPGIFRGQSRDWPLIPQAFRTANFAETDLSDVIRSFRWIQSTGEFRRFCERAEAQNPAFPSAVEDRMSIAQHFGVPTPLLDWSQNIFTALYFAIRDIYSATESEGGGRLYLYHVIDERLLRSGVPSTDDGLSGFGESAFIKPYHIDRRIERQRAVFTYHPHPCQQPRRIPAKRYVLEWDLVRTLLDLMKGFGFTEDYYFPDYAGIAHAVMSDRAL